VRRVRIWFRRRVESLRAFLRKLRRARKITVVDTGVAVEHSSALPLTHYKKPPVGEPLERTVERLIGLSVEMQQRLAQVEHGLEQQPDRWQRDIARGHEEMEMLMDAKVEAAADAHIRIRLWGIVLLLAGVPLLAWANFLE
jgi:hypothetical protein